MGVGSGDADTVEGGHDAQSAGILDGGLGAAQLVLAGLLLSHKDGNAGTVDLGIVEGEMLGGDDNAVLLAAADEGNGLTGGKDGILGIILMVAGVVGGAVQVGAAAPEDGQVAPQAVVAADLAVLVGEVFVEGLGNDGLVDHRAEFVCEVGVVGIHGAGVGTGFVGVGILAERIAVDAVGAIVLDSLGAHDRLDGFGGGAAQTQTNHALLQGELIHQQTPALIIKVSDTLQVRQSQAVVGTEGDGGRIAVCVDLIDVIVQNVEHLIGGGQILIGLGESAFPVGTGQIGSSAGQPVVDIHVSQLVLHSGAILGRCESGGVLRAQIPALGLVCVTADILTLGSQNVLHSLMCTVADGKVVVTGIENVAALGTGRVVSRGIPACHVLHICGDGHSLGGTGRKLGGLAVVQQLNSGFLHTMLFVIIGVGQADIELHNILTGDAAGVLDGHVRGDGLVFQVNIQVIEGLLKRGVGQTVTERISNLIVIVPSAVGGGAHGGGSVALVHNGVKVTGLIVLVADVDVFCLDNGIIHLNIGVGIGPLQVAEVLCSGRVCVLDGIGIGQMTGGADRTGENVGHTVEAVAARQTDLQDGINADVVLDLLHLHGAGIIQQNDDLAAVGRLGGDGCIDEVALVVGQAQRVSLVQVLGGINTGSAGVVAAVFRGGAGNRDDHDIVVIHAVLPVCILTIHRGLARLLAGENAGGGGCGDVVVLHSAAPALDLGFVRRLEGLVHIGHSLVQTETLCLEGTDHINGIGIRAGVCNKAGTHIAALNGIVAREAKQCDLLGLILRQRQCAVVLQQDAALFAHPLTHVLNAVQQLGSGGVVGFESIQVSAVGVLGHELGALGAQELVNVGAESVHDGRGADTERQQRRRGRGHAAPDAAAGFFLTHVFPPCVSLCIS